MATKSLSLRYRRRRLLISLGLLSVVAYLVYFRISASLKFSTASTPTPTPTPVWQRPQRPKQTTAKKVSKPLPTKHVFRNDGIVDVSNTAPHPIYEMISRAERKWKEKTQKASKTLEEAVIEYRRRYKREPPAGFDKW